MNEALNDRIRSLKSRGLLYGVTGSSLLLALAVPALAVNPTNTMLADPKQYFPGCTCNAAFFSFLALMVACLIIAMFQYGEKRKKKLSAYQFSIIAIILAFIIYSIPLWTMVYLLSPSGFQVDEESGVYAFSVYGEKGSDGSEFQGKYTTDELAKHLNDSRTYIVSTWAIMSVICVAAMATVPSFLKRQAKKREETYVKKRKKRPSKGRIGSRKVKDKSDEADKKGKKK